MHILHFGTRLNYQTRSIHIPSHIQSLHKSVETHVMFPHSVRLEFCCICLFSDGHCSCMCSDANTANLRLSLHIVIIVVLAVRCCRVSGMLCCSCMCSFGAPSLKCMVNW